MLFQLKAVSKTYGWVKALDAVSIDVQPGAIGLLGPNGAGKSTLIKALLGLVNLTGGEATVLGHDVRRAGKRIRDEIGYMPEDDCLIAGLKGVESVAFAGEMGGIPRRTAMRRAHEILDFVGLTDGRYREVQTYSMGMKQRVKLAQALVHSPKLLFLDEPTSGLDPGGRRHMLQLIRTFSREKNISVVVSTHILTDIEESCDSAMILGHGKLLRYDSLENMRTRRDGSFLVRFDPPPAEGYVGGEKADDPAKFVAALNAASIAAELVPESDVPMARITCEGDRLPDDVFRVAVNSKVSIRKVSASRNTLEDVFLQAVTQGAGHAHL